MRLEKLKSASNALNCNLCARSDCRRHFGISCPKKQQLVMKQLLQELPGGVRVV
ncbi:unnamed protein product, partial [Larinioides sclopetarius]